MHAADRLLLRSGQECLGGLCDAFGSTSSNPWICTQPCASQGDCPGNQGNYTCSPVGNYGFRAVSAEPYTGQ